MLAEGNKDSIDRSESTICLETNRKKKIIIDSLLRCLFITSIQLRSVFFIRYCTIVQSAASWSYLSLIIKDTSTRLRYDVQLCVHKFINIEWFLDIITRMCGHFARKRRNSHSSIGFSLFHPCDFRDFNKAHRFNNSWSPIIP